MEKEFGWHPGGYQTNKTVDKGKHLHVFTLSEQSELVGGATAAKKVMANWENGEITLSSDDEEGNAKLSSKKLPVFTPIIKRTTKTVVFNEPTPTPTALS